MSASNFCFLLLQFSLFFILQTPAFASKQSYIVYLGAHSHGPNPTSDDFDRAENYHHEFLGSILGSGDKAKESISSSYRRHINGFAADLEEEHAQQLAKHPDVVSIFLNKPKKMLTTRAWNFLELEKANVIPPKSAWKRARFGEDVIIGGIDSGVWPESESFSDTDMGPVPSRWRGTCQNDTHYGVKCNRKLIGIKQYNKGVIASALKRNSSFTTPPQLETGRDLDGHGTHTLATAGGSFVPNVSVSGSGYGTAKGGSPRARVASYKVCWYSDHHTYGKGDDCTEQDIIEAFDDAIQDGVDLLTVSLGDDQTDEFLSDGIVIGSFHAMMNGILTVAAAGNDGTGPETVNNMAPWILTVAASTMDREFAGYITLGNNKILRGASLSTGMPSQNSYPLISGQQARVANATDMDAKICETGTLDPDKVKGKILVCHEDGKSYVGAQAGAVAMISLGGGTFSASYGFIPVTKLNYSDFERVLAYINCTRDPVASMTDAKTEFNTNPSPAVASFSARGPSKIDPSIIKPDVTAPGVNIIAATTGERGPVGDPHDDRRIPFTTMDGTSMATPIVSGIAGLIKSVHPDWSPSAIKSAIMTTARTTDASKRPILDFNGAEATPFAYGSGHVNANRALDPGLVYDLTLDDYLGYLCSRRYEKDTVKKFVEDPEKYLCPNSFDLKNFNYPSIAIPELIGSVTATRSVKNVGTPGKYTAQVSEIPGISVNVEPNTLNFTKVNEQKTFNVTFTPQGNVKPNEDYVFGELIWTDGFGHHVRSPIALKGGSKKFTELDKLFNLD